MGSCVSVHRDSAALFGFRLGSGGSPSKGRHMPDVTKVEDGGDDPGGGFEHDNKPVDSGLQLKCASFGSTHETFFDTRAWLDSDCEDDFFSVNGDFIPSGNSTPNHQIITPKTPRLSETFIGTSPDTRTEPSPRKKFAELLMETTPDEEVQKEQAVNGKDDERIEVNGKPESPTGANLPSNSHDTSPHVSGTKSIGRSSESPSNGNATSGKQKTSKTMHCCFPGVVPTFNLHDGKKQRLPHQSQNIG